MKTPKRKSIAGRDFSAHFLSSCDYFTLFSDDEALAGIMHPVLHVVFKTEECKRTGGVLAKGKKRMTEAAAFKEKFIGIEFAYHAIQKKKSKTYICYKENWKHVICLNFILLVFINLNFKKEKSVLGEHRNVM